MNIKTSRDLCILFACTNFILFMAFKTPLNGYISILMVISAVFMEYHNDEKI